MTLDEAARCLAEAGIANPRGEARLLLAGALGLTRDETLTLRDLSPAQTERFAALVERRLTYEPLAYITRRREFWGLEFEVGPGVLVPRPDTETLIEQALALYPDRNAALRLADLGAGSGALLVAALTEFPNATGAGFEASNDAFRFALRNAATHVPGRAEIYLTGWDKAEGPFDLVFSNPPYIPTADIDGLESDVARFEPHAALDGGADGLCAYRSLAVLLPRILRPGGVALLEIGIGQAEAVKSVFSGLEMVHLAPDLAGIPRCMVLRNSHGTPLEKRTRSGKFDS